MIFESHVGDDGGVYATTRENVKKGWGSNYVYSIQQQQKTALWSRIACIDRAPGERGGNHLCYLSATINFEGGIGFLSLVSLS